MPIYEYRCEDCGQVKEHLQKLSDAPIAECPACGGHGSVEKWPGQRATADAWGGFDPPTGDGWQMWENTSEGSPMSPVFETADALIDWLVDTGASYFGDTTASREQWSAVVMDDEPAMVQIAPGVVAM